jgi:hypothetical protein
MQVLIFFPFFANDAEELNLDKEQCLTEAGEVHVKCRGWFKWHNQILASENRKYPLYNIAYYSAYKHIIACGVIAGIGWLTSGVLALLLGRNNSKGLLMTVSKDFKYVVQSADCGHLLHIHRDVRRHPIQDWYSLSFIPTEIVKMSYFDIVHTDADREKLGESSSGIITVGAIALVFASVSLLACLLVKPERHEHPKAKDEALILKPEEKKQPSGPPEEEKAAPPA